MPAQAAIAINDGKATPVLHTFAAFGVGTAAKQGEFVASYMNRAASVLTGGAETIQVFIRPKKADGGFALRGTLALPITELVNGANTVTRTLTASFSVNIPPNATLAERTDLRQLLINALTHTQVTTAIMNAEPIT